MIPYEELVSALAQWRARNGLATEGETFLAGPAQTLTGVTQGAALPLAGGEIVDLEEEGALEEIEAYDDEVESAVAGIGGDPDAYGADDSTAYGADDSTAYGADDSTAYGDAAGYADEGGYGEETHAVDAADAVVEVDEGFEVESVAVDEGFEVESVAVDDGGDFGSLEGEPTSFSQMPESPGGESTRVGEAPDFAAPDDDERPE